MERYYTKPSTRVQAIERVVKSFFQNVKLLIDLNSYCLKGLSCRV